eukprot:931930-Heterocapsa_arctica.AAC.1
MCERHGAVLASIVDASVEQLSIVGYEEMSQAMTAATVVKNRRPDRTGFSARSRAFGSDETLPASVIANMTDKAILPALDLATKSDG